MQLGILSDIHDHIEGLRTALQTLQATNALICCGDLCSPFIIKELGTRYPNPIHIVFGNNDGDLFRITQNSNAFSQIHLHGELAELEFEGCRIGVNHYDTIGRVLAESNRYDVVCFGHNHQFEVSQSGETLILNPGEILGGLTGQSTFLSFNPSDRSYQQHTL